MNIFLLKFEKCYLGQYGAKCDISCLTISKNKANGILTKIYYFFCNNGDQMLNTSFDSVDIHRKRFFFLFV